MTTHKGFINPLWLLVIPVILLGGGAYWYIQQPAPQGDTQQPIVLPVATDAKPIAQEPQQTQISSDLKEGSSYAYNGAEYKVVDTVQNPFAKDQILVVTVKTQLAANQCGGLYDYGPCDFFLDSYADNKIRSKHLGSLSMKSTFERGSGHFIDANTFIFGGLLGDGGVSIQDEWQVTLDPWTSKMLSRTQNGESI